MQRTDFENITLRNSPTKHIILFIIRIGNGIGLSWKCPIVKVIMSARLYCLCIHLADLNDLKESINTEYNFMYCRKSNFFSYDVAVIQWIFSHVIKTV